MRSHILMIFTYKLRSVSCWNRFVSNMFFSRNLDCYYFAAKKHYVTAKKLVYGCTRLSKNTGKHFNRILENFHKNQDKKIKRDLMETPTKSSSKENPPGYWRFFLWIFVQPNKKWIWINEIYISRSKKLLKRRQIKAGEIGEIWKNRINW